MKTEIIRDFGNGFTIQKMYANKLENGGYGDIYDSREDILLRYPSSEILEGYVVIGSGGFIPSIFNDWNDTYEDALDEYWNNINSKYKPNFKIGDLIFDTYYGEHGIIVELIDKDTAKVDYESVDYSPSKSIDIAELKYLDLENNSVNSIVNIIEDAIAIGEYRIQEVEIESDNGRLLVWHKSSDKHYEITVVESNN